MSETATLTTSSTLMDSEVYVANGAFDCTDQREWAETFKSLGGVSAMITSGWQHPGAPAGFAIVEVVGSAAAVAFAEGTVNA